MAHTRNQNEVWPLRDSSVLDGQQWRYEMVVGEKSFHVTLRRFRVDGINRIDVTEMHFPMGLLVKFAKAWARDVADNVVEDLLGKLK